MMNYPKVLVVSGYSFNQNSGGSITLSNLFRGWPKDRLAIVDADSCEHDLAICDRRFRLSNPRVAKHADERATPRLSNRIARILGLSGGVFPLKVKPELLDFVSEFSPDYIYTQASQLSYIWLVKALLKVNGCKVAYHVMDDFVQTTYRSGLFSIVPRLLLSYEVKRLVERSHVRMGISLGMCDAYKSRFGYEFFPFHNPVEPTDWPERSDSKRVDSSEFVITYSGRIGLGARSSLAQVAQAVFHLRGAGFKVSFHVFARPSEADRDEICGSGGACESVVRFFPPPTSIQELRAALLSSDLLVLPVDFDSDSYRFLKLSMPTKLPAYMMSATPILAYGPADIFSVRFVADRRVGYVCSDKSKLVGVIKAAIENESGGRTYAAAARDYAEQNFSGEVVRERFRRAFVD